MRSEQQHRGKSVAATWHYVVHRPFEVGSSSVLAADSIADRLMELRAATEMSFTPVSAHFGASASVPLHLAGAPLSRSEPPRVGVEASVRCLQTEIRSLVTASQEKGKRVSCLKLSDAAADALFVLEPLDD